MAVRLIEGGRILGPRSFECQPLFSKKKLAKEGEEFSTFGFRFSNGKARPRAAAAAWIYGDIPIGQRATRAAILRIAGRHVIGTRAALLCSLGKKTSLLIPKITGLSEINPFPCRGCDETYLDNFSIGSGEPDPGKVITVSEVTRQLVRSGKG